MRDRSRAKATSAQMALAVAAFFVAPAISLVAAEAEVKQNTSYVTTDQTNRVGSDQSLESSTTYAMTALINLASLNIPGAVSNGMTAYGKYRNSETLDRLGDQNLNLAGSLSSVGTAPNAGAVKTNTTFRRLDPAFLRKGDAATVAAEFERRSGMPREQFLSHLSEISEKKLRASDPELVDKVLSRFENFVAKIPNPEFRNNLQKGVNMVPDTVRTGLISKAVSKFATMIAGGPSAPNSDVSAASSPSPSKISAATPVQMAANAGNDAVTGAEPAPAGDRAPASLEQFRSPLADSEGDGKNPLGNVVQAALETQNQDLTIFQLVSRRYRIVTPQLSL